MNPLLQQAEQAILSKVNPQQLVPAIQKIVGEGKKILYSPQTRSMVINQLSKSNDMAHVAGEGAAKLIAMILHQAPGSMPPQAMIPAATMLLCECLDLLEGMGKTQVTPEILANSMKEMSSSLMQLFGVTPERLQALISKSQAGGAQPGQAAPEPMQSQAAPAAPMAPAGGLIAQARGGMA
jgi:hypothetical protein